MNANPKFLAASAHVDDAAVKPLPNSRKIYIGQLRVPMREITQSGGNAPLAVYDTSGPYTDPAAKMTNEAEYTTIPHSRPSRNARRPSTS